MSGVYPIPTGRASDTLLHARMLAQLAFDQRNLLLSQEQISTGRAFSRPSDAPSQAVRGLEIQRTIEVKEQYQVNITTSQSFLDAADAAATGSLNTIRDVRASILTAISTTTTATQRDSIISEIQNAMGFVADLGNTTFRGRQLFGGSENTLATYQVGSNNLVTYNGNSQLLTTFADRDFRVQTNLPGADIFGGLSASVISDIGLSPSLQESTRLSDLFGGEGVSLSTIRISDGNKQSDIDLKGVKTVGDLIGRIRRNAPEGRTLRVEIQGNQLSIDWADQLGGTLRIEDLSGGSFAKRLGIEQLSGNFLGAVSSLDLNAAVRSTSALSDLFGTRARARIESSDWDNDIAIQALENGSAGNGYHFQLVDDALLTSGPGVDAGNETVSFSPVATPAQAAVTLTGSNNDLVLTATTPGTDFNHVSIQLVNGGAIGNTATATYDASAGRLNLVVDGSGGTQIQTLLNAINAEGTFSAAYDPTTPADGGYVPTAPILAADLNKEVGNTSQSGGEANTFFVHVNATNSTANDVVSALSADATFSDLFEARLDTYDGASRSNQGTGRLSFSSIGASVGGEGESIDLASGLQITVGEQTYTVRFEGAKTVEDLLNRIQFSGAPVLAELDGTGHLQVRSRLSGANFSIGENGGVTATQLGLRSFSESTRIDALNFGRGIETKEGTDFTIRRNDGVEIEIDVSSARTIGDVLDLINDHPDNQDSGRVEARLALVGNGIEIVDDDPVGEQTLTILSAFGSRAAEGLGLIPAGATEGFANQGAEPTRAALDVELPIPNDVNTAFRLEAVEPGSNYNGVKVILVDGGAIGDTATAVYDGGAGTLTITIDPGATTTNRVLQAIEAEGHFRGELSTTAGPNNGTGVLGTLGSLGITAGGSSTPEAQPAKLALAFPSPADVNTSFTIEAPSGGTFWNGVEVIFDNSLSGDVAVASYNSGLKQLTISLDAAATSTNTILSAINLEGTFNAALDLETDPTNDGTGIPGAAGTQGLLEGGTAEALQGRDVNPQTTGGVFDSFSRLIRALQGDSPDLGELERLGDQLDDDMTRINFALADIGARSRALEVVQTRVEDESVSLRATLSEEVDADLVTVIS
ncbi:MAG: hypothetical protein KDA83_03030, partial [Planctomycetales bacterium]|nr:hypothetical protein [Planctomycetales bacterium]